MDIIATAAMESIICSSIVVEHSDVVFFAPMLQVGGLESWETLASRLREARHAEPKNAVDTRGIKGG